MTEAETERLIQATGRTAPRVTLGQLDARIRAEQYYVFPGTTVTACALTLDNGYVVVGISAAASPENFDEQLGRSVARSSARSKMWPLEGYLLRERLHQAEAQ